MKNSTGTHGKDGLTARSALIHQIISVGVLLRGFGPRAAMPILRISRRG
jgi:hypothetical protein